MKSVAILLLVAGLASCATLRSGSGARPVQLFNDRLFAPPSVRIDAGDVFAVTDDMRRYLFSDIAEQLRVKGSQQGLIDALYSKSQLKVEYDAAVTRNAAQTFADRAGNCLSLAIMTAALARTLGMPVQFQSVVVDETWTRSGDLYFSVGHVNLTVGRRYSELRSRYDDNALLTIDFVPPGETRGQRSWPISQETVVAMYMNNRAAEALARGQVNDAYWWAREALTQDPDFRSAYNTLGVLYRRHGNLAEAELVFRYALGSDPDNLQLMSNLALVLADHGRTGEAQALAARVEERRPYAPYHFFKLGQKAIYARDFKSARELFIRELRRDPYNHELHFWLGAAFSGLGDMTSSQKHLSIALEFSTTRAEHALYSAKLDRLRAAYK